MENIIVLTALYILAIALIYAPKCPAKTATETPINYFPSVEDEPENETPETLNPVTVSPVNSVIPETLTPSSESLESSKVAIAPNPSPDLKSLSIRALKKLASEKKVPRYSNLTKSQLIAAMA